MKEKPLFGNGSKYEPTARVAEVLGVKAQVIRNAILAGELAAMNIANSTKRPIWRISKEQWQEFLDRRSSEAVVFARKMKRAADQIELSKKSYV